MGDPENILVKRRIAAELAEAVKHLRTMTRECLNPCEASGCPKPATHGVLQPDSTDVTDVMVFCREHAGSEGRQTYSDKTTAALEWLSARGANDG